MLSATLSVVVIASALVGVAPVVGVSGGSAPPAAERIPVGSVEATTPVARCELSASEVEPGGSVTLNASASQEATAYRYDRLGDGNFGPWRDSATRTVSYEDPGTYEPRVEVRSADDTRDTATCGTLTVAENQPPTAAFSYSPSEPAPGETVSFTSESSDADGDVVAYEWSVDGTTVAETPGVEYSFEEAGEHLVELTVTDDDGTTNTTSATVTVVENQPPTVDLTHSPEQPAPGEQVTVTANATDEDGEVVGYEWIVDGEVIVMSPDSEFGYVFEEPGEHIVEVVVEDDDGATARANRAVRVSREQNQPPTVELSYTPTEPDPGETVRFEAEASDEDGDVVRYEWTVDGEPVAESPNLEYSFEEAGEHLVEVTVTDDDGATAASNATVAVDSAEETPTPTGDVRVTAEWGHTPSGPRVGQQVTLFANGPSDPRLAYRWDIGDDGTVDIEGRLVDYAFAETGEHAVTLEVVGPDGERETHTATITVQAGRERIGDGGLSVWMTPATPRPGQRVTLVADPAPGNQVETYRWDLDGDGEIDKRGRTVTYSFPDSGATTVTVETVDVNGRVNASSSTVSTTGEPAPRERDGPSVWITPTDPEPGQRVTLVADAVVPSDKVEAYRWDLDGDGDPDAEGRIVTYSFPEDGRFSVSVTVERTNGSSATVKDSVGVGNATAEPERTTAGDTTRDRTTTETTTAETTTDGGMSGFGGGVALVALVAGAGLLVRRAGP